MDFYILGLIFGIAVGLIVWLIARKRGTGSQYDERQLIARGKASNAGFVTLAVCIGVSCVLESSCGLPVSPLTWYSSSLILSVAVFVLTAIHYDAYVSLTDTSGRIIRSGCLLAAAMLLIGLTNFRSDRELSRQLSIMDLELAAVWAAVVIALLLRRRKTEEEAAE